MIVNYGFSGGIELTDELIERLATEAEKGITMGQSPSADLYWGYNLGDMTDPDTGDSIKPEWMSGEDDEEDSLEWEEVYAIRMGWEPLPAPDWPDRDYREPYERRRAKEKAFRQTDEYKAWSANREQMRVLTKDLPVELDTYGYHDEPLYCVRVKTSVQRVDDWGSIELAPLVVNPEWHDQVVAFMTHLDLPISEGETPGWHLNCSYG